MQAEPLTLHEFTAAPNRRCVLTVWLLITTATSSTACVRLFFCIERFLANRLLLWSYSRGEVQNPDETWPKLERDEGRGDSGRSDGEWATLW